MFKVRYVCNCGVGNYEAELESNPILWTQSPAKCIHCGIAIRIGEVINLTPRAGMQQKKSKSKTKPPPPQEEQERLF